MDTTAAATAQVSIDVDYQLHQGEVFVNAAREDAAKYGVTITPVAKAGQHPTVTISGQRDHVQAFLTGEGYDDPELYTV